ncbi:MAG: sensor histidine kinase [Alphaproteobacteria bacterium]
MRAILSSVRLRLAAGAVTALVCVLVLSWFGLVQLFERHVERRIGAELDLHLSQIASATLVMADGTLSLEREPADPRFVRVRSGLYWQVEDEATGRMLRSRSLWDARLRLPQDMPAIGVIDVHDAEGPGGERLRAHERRLMLPDGIGERALRFAVAIDRADIEALTADFASDLVLALVVLGMVLGGASLIQITMGTAPLAGIGRQVAAVRAGQIPRLPPAPAQEVRPLVDEVNALLDGADAQVERARARAADLAHGLKTPLAALKADAARIAAGGSPEIAAGIHEAVDAMSAQVERELARSRIRHGVRAADTSLLPVVAQVAGVIRRTPAGERVTIGITVPAGVRLAIDRTDLAELMGNLRENAARHARGRVDVSVVSAGDGFCKVVVDDDGPGLDEAARAAVMQRGVRLDTRPEGAGLGLAIVSDILDAYGSVLELGDTPDRGLSASFRVRASSCA